MACPLLDLSPPPAPAPGRSPADRAGRPARRAVHPSSAATAMAARSSCRGSWPGLGSHDVGPAVGLGAKQADDEREAHIIPPPYLVQERLICLDDDVEALQRVGGDGPRVRAVRDRELGVAGGAFEELTTITGDSAAEIADPVGEAA